MKNNRKVVFGFYFIINLVLLSACSHQNQVPYISNDEQEFIVETAISYFDSLPVTVTAEVCERSAGGPNDFYSEGDYWWPDPENPDGPYVQRDGQTNPENFVAHRLAMIRLSQIVGKQTSAWLLTGDQKFADAVGRHLEDWFVNPGTRMNPSLNYAQAIKGRVTGRGIGIIDAIHLIELWKTLDGYPETQEVIRNLPIRNPLLWVMDKPA